MRLTTPQGAKDQLEKMIQSGQISSDKLKSLATEAKQIAQMMGVH